MTPYYEHNGITIYHGDCRDVLDSITADVLVTDPPYGVNLGHHGAANEKRSGWLAKKPYSLYDDTPVNFRTVVVPAIRHALAKVDRGVVFAAGHMIHEYPNPAAIGGVFLPAACGRNPWGFQSLAHCLFYGTAPDLQKGSKATAISSSESANTVVGHPCPKPLGWMRWAVDLASMTGETVLDPFMGSGTTLRAAKDLGRQAIGIEIEERYCEIAAKRLSQEVLDFGEVA
jgi:site-specific DNA-methyltransferase (adenine-specific)